MWATSTASNCSMRKPRAADADSPASFQPLKAHAITGFRRAGLSSQIKSGTFRTVPEARSVRAHFDNGWVPGTAEHPSTITALREGSALDAVFACSRKERLTTRAGAPYLSLELR